MRKDQRGVVYLETLIAFLPVFAFFLGTLQLADISVAHLVVQHASSTAARAAVVVLPDDGAWYGDRQNQGLHQFSGARQVDIERAADLILRANTRLHREGVNVSVAAANFADRNDLVATVESRYRCLIPAMCGSGVDLRSESKLVYQGARYPYEPLGQVLDYASDRARQAARDGMANAGDPRAGEVEGRPLFDDVDPNQQNPNGSQQNSNGSPQNANGSNQQNSQGSSQQNPNGSAQDPNGSSQNPNRAGQQNPNGSPQNPNNPSPQNPNDPRPGVHDPSSPSNPNNNPNPSNSNGQNGNRPDLSPPQQPSQPGRPGAGEQIADNRPIRPGTGQPSQGPASPGTTRPGTATGPVANGPGRPNDPGTNGARPATPTGPVASGPGRPNDPGTNDGTSPARPGVIPTGPGVDLTKPGAAPTRPGDTTGPIASPTGPGVDLTKPGGTAPSRPGVDLTKPGVRPGVDLTPPGRPGPVAGIRPPLRGQPACTGAACGRPGGACFVAGTLVSTPDGSKEIESVSAGDAVYAYDENARGAVVARVSRAFIRRASTLVDVTIRYLNDGREFIISATPEHPFYVLSTGEYVPVGSLPVGAVLLALDGTPAEVVSASTRSGEYDVFNFTVEGHHNYFVAAESIQSAVLVHNLNGCDGNAQAEAAGLPAAPDGYQWLHNPNGPLPIAARDPSNSSSTTRWFNWETRTWVRGVPPKTPAPPFADLPPSDQQLDGELDDFRGSLPVARDAPQGGTAAVGRTDVPGLEGIRFEGASSAPRRLTTPHPRHIQNTTVSNRDRYDAEIDLSNHFIESVNNAGIAPDDVVGTLNIRVEQAVCSTCRAGVNGNGAGPGALRQLSLMYPNLMIRATARDTGEVIYVQNGLRVFPPP